MKYQKTKKLKTKTADFFASTRISVNFFFKKSQNNNITFYENSRNNNIILGFSIKYSYLVFRLSKGNFSKLHVAKK